MNILNTRYDSINPGDKIFTNGKDNHMFRKLKFEEIEEVKEVNNYLTRNDKRMFLVLFASGDKTYGWGDRVLEAIQ